LPVITEAVALLQNTVMCIKRAVPSDLYSFKTTMYNIEITKETVFRVQ